jgi:PLP dependent protein
VIDEASLQLQLSDVRERIAAAAARSGRDPSEVRLVAVSKTFGADAVRIAARAGQVDFGENKVQEALQKMAQTADLQVRWHLVGHLQSNKARKAATSFSAIHSIDSAALHEVVDRAAEAAGHRVDVLLQVDMAGEPGKHGARVEELSAILDAGRKCRTARIVGLMLLPPAVNDPEEVRPYFRSLRELRDRLVASGAEKAMLAELSMGMSHDFEIAVEEGSTLVRVGTAIFGERTYLGGEGR